MFIIKIFNLFLLGAVFLFADSYNMELLSNFSYEQNTSDITAFYQDSREFAVIGLQNAASFVDVTDPYNPFEIGRIGGGTSLWRDLKYWNRHVYIGTEAEDGVKVVSVDDPDNPVLVNTILDFDNNHNIHVADGYLYVVGADIHDIWIYDLTDPANPELAGFWDTEYIHDLHVYNDIVLFNRQPSLHKMSMMQHRVVPLPYNRPPITIPCVVTLPYNPSISMCCL